MVRDGADWRQRVGGWLAGTGLDAWVVQRELADPISYISLWLSDAGEDPDQVARRGSDWFDWFAEEKITGIGMGVITVRKRAGSRSTDGEHTLEEITAAGEEVTGPEAKAFLDRRAYLRAHDDDHLLTARLACAPVFCETQSLPGDDGWQEIGSAVRAPADRALSSASTRYRERCLPDVAERSNWHPDRFACRAPRCRRRRIGTGSTSRGPRGDRPRNPLRGSVNVRSRTTLHRLFTWCETGRCRVIR